MVVVLVLVLRLGLGVVQMFRAGHTAKGVDRALDLCRFFVVGFSTRLEFNGEMGGQAVAIGYFLGRQLGVHTRDIQLLAQARPWCGGGVLHQAVVTPANIAQLDDHRR